MNTRDITDYQQCSTAADATEPAAPVYPCEFCGATRQERWRLAKHLRIAHGMRVGEARETAAGTKAITPERLPLEATGLIWCWKCSTYHHPTMPCVGRPAAIAAVRDRAEFAAGGL